MIILFISSIDATNSNYLGKYVNDSPERYSNATMKRVRLKNEIHLCLFASKVISIGTEIRFDFTFYFI